MEIKHHIGTELKSIFKDIIDENLDVEGWSLLESSDQFQTPNYCGGFDATENEFTFSFFDLTKNEYWFQLSLIDIQEIINGNGVEIHIRKAEDY